MPQTIELNIFVQQFSNCDKFFLYIDIFIQLDLGGTQMTYGFFILDFRTAEFCGFITWKTLMNKPGITRKTVSDFPLLSLVINSRTGTSFVFKSGVLIRVIILRTCFSTFFMFLQK